MSSITARRLLFAQGPRITEETFSIPAPGPNQILVRIVYSHVSAGSEMNFIRFGPAGYGIKAPADAALPIGYQSVGRIEAIGPGITGWKLGERVITGSTHGSHYLADLTNPNLILDRVPDNVSDLAAGFAILGDVSLHSIRRAQLQIDESVAIFGMGLVGQMVLQLARASGAHHLIAVDLSDNRLAKARESGATHVIHAGRENAVERIREITGDGAETVIHCTQVAKILQQLLECAANRGKVVLTGSAPGKAEISLQDDLLRREVSIIGTYEAGLSGPPHAYWRWTRQRNRLACLRMMAAGTLKLEPLITHIIAPGQAQATFETMMRENDSWLGVVVKWE